VNWWSYIILIVGVQFLGLFLIFFCYEGEVLAQRLYYFSYIKLIYLSSIFCERRENSKYFNVSFVSRSWNAVHGSRMSLVIVVSFYREADKQISLTHSRACALGQPVRQASALVRELGNVPPTKDPQSSVFAVGSCSYFRTDEAYCGNKFCADIATTLTMSEWPSRRRHVLESWEVTCVGADDCYWLPGHTVVIPPSIIHKSRDMTNCLRDLKWRHCYVMPLAFCSHLTAIAALNYSTVPDIAWEEKNDPQDV